MDQFRWIDQTQPGRLVQGTMMLYISAGFDLFNSFLVGGPISLVFLVLALLKAGGAWGIANEKKLGYYAGCTGICLSVLLNLFLLTVSPVTGLISLAISLWIASLVLHESCRGYVRVWFK